MPVNPYRAGESLPDASFAAIRRELVLRCCKWDPQVGDTNALARFPLLLPRAEWTRLAALAEALSAEALAAEAELLGRPELVRQLGLPRALRRTLLADAPSPTAVRVMRFDFHWTREGWRISELNSDVPGGYTESTAFASLVSRRFPGTSCAGSPLSTWASALARAAGDEPVALLAAPGYLEDQQVVAALGRALRELGVASHLVQPEHLEWRDRRAFFATSWTTAAVGAIGRFFQSEWLAPVRPHRFLFTGGRTPLANPGVAILLESKRFPLTWPELRTPLPTWRALLPETRDVREVPWRTSDAWVLKAALANNGDAVVWRELASSRAWRKAAFDATLWPSSWVAQRRFEAVPLDTPEGPRFPCLGVYTIDGRAEGIYGRLAARPLIDYGATDVAVLVEDAGARP